MIVTAIGGNVLLVVAVVECSLFASCGVDNRHPTNAIDSAGVYFIGNSHTLHTERASADWLNA